jgi:hypothetical protein
MAAKQMRADNEPLPKIVRLRGVKSVIDLSQGPDKDEDNGKREQYAGELQRGKEADDFLNEHRDIWRIE